MNFQYNSHSIIEYTFYPVPEFLWEESADDLLVVTKLCKVEITGANVG